MNRLSTADRTRAIACLVEGNSQRATCRMTGLAKKTVARLAVEIGEACERFADNVMRDLPCTRIQCDEIWSFCYAKAKNVPVHLRGSGAGDVWTWVAIDPDTKLIPVWYIGDRTAEERLSLHAQRSEAACEPRGVIHRRARAYLIAVEAAFHLQPVDYGVSVKIYGENTLEGKYSPGECIGTERTIISGNMRKAKSAQAMLSARISRCECRCGGLHA
jgi:hypothetical protein